MQNDFFDIIIVGGGLVGKTAALMLSQLQLKTLLLTDERVSTKNVSTSDDRIYALSHSTQALLQQCKIWETLDQDALCPVHEMKIFGEAPSTGLDLSAYQACTEALAWIAPSTVIEKALDTALNFSTYFQCISARATAIQTHKDHVAVTLDQGRTVSAKLLIGADGAHSFVRQEMGIDVQQHESYCKFPNTKTSSQQSFSMVFYMEKSFRNYCVAPFAN